MSTILFVLTLILWFMAILFAFAYLWINTFLKREDLESRNLTLLKITKRSMIFSLIFGLLQCLLANHTTVRGAIERTSGMFLIMGIGWLFIILMCGVTILITVVSKTRYYKDLAPVIKKILSIAIGGAFFGLILSWLLA